jgi:multidrug resistance protein
MVEDSKRRSITFVVFLTMFLDLVGFGIIIPIQPFFAENYGASPTLITLLGGSFSLMQFIFVPVWGRLSDRIGRRPVMLGSIAITAVGYALFATAETIEMLFVSRMLAGFGAANIATSLAIMADISPPDERAKAMGIIGAAFGLGFVFGPAIGGLLGQISPQAPIWAAAGLSTINLIAAVFLLPETLKESERATRERNMLRVFRRVAKRQNVMPLLLTTLVITTGFSLMEQVLGLFIEHSWVTGSVEVQRDLAFKEAAGLTGIVLVVIGVVMSLVQGKYIGPLVKRYGEKRLLLVGAVGNVVTLALIPATVWVGFWGLLVVGAMMGLFSGIWSPSLQSVLSRSVEPDEQGATMGLNQSLSSLGRVVGPAFAGVLYELSRDIPFLLGAAIVSLTVLLIVKVQQPESDSD